MSIITRNLIEYHGISLHSCVAENFKQFNIDNMIQIPIEKPDIEHISKVWAEVKIINKHIVKTPVGKSLEGQNLTGYKVLVDGDINIKVEYSACRPSQSIHSSSSKFPFCSYVVLPKEYNPGGIVVTTTVIEDIFAEQLDSRCVYANITMMLIADIC